MLRGHAELVHRYLQASAYSCTRCSLEIQVSLTMASQALFDRYNTIQARLEALESHPAFKKPPSVALEERQLAILERIGRLAAAVGIGADSALAPAPTRPRPTVTPDASPIQQKLEQELIDKGFSHFR